MQKRLLTTREVAKMLHVSILTVQGYCRDGYLTAVGGKTKRWFIEASSVEKFVKDSSVMYRSPAAKKKMDESEKWQGKEHGGS